MTIRRPATCAIAFIGLLALSACETQFGNVEDDFSSYSKPGASESARDAAVRECVFGPQGGGRTGRVGNDVRDLRIETCLQQKGYRRG
ncbi:MAG: hypothetical protein AAF495_13555 [Pseudomonadota bacterium]